jgi:hypothetical protein
VRQQRRVYNPVVDTAIEFCSLPVDLGNSAIIDEPALV